MTRRELFFTPALMIAAAGTPRPLSLNEDSNHFFVNRRKQRLTRELIRQWVDQYRGTLVEELILNVNAMRSSFASRHREAWWDGFDPQAGPGQKFLDGLADAARPTWFEWIRCAWQMHQDGLDLYSIWIPEIRRQGMKPWVSMRMNDLHDVDKEEHPLHSSFWKEHKDWRRVPYRGEQRDKALDYTRPEVRAYQFRYLEEICERYDFDGLELDWMRFGFHLPPGREHSGVLREFQHETRKLLQVWEKIRGHKITLAVRVPSAPRTARRLGMDAVEWAHLGLADFVTVTNFWRTVDNGMPVEQWRKLLPKTVRLAAGLELGLNAFPGSVAAKGRAWQSNSLETARGSALAYLEQGAGKIYLFNYMDSDTTLDVPSQYPPLLRGLTDAAAPRRHVVTYQDTWAPGETPAAALPVQLEAGRWTAFRLLTGPPAPQGVVRLGLSQPSVTVRLNGELLAPGVKREDLLPGPSMSLLEFACHGLRPGENVVEVAADSPVRIEWVEVAVSPAR
ncbi:MAG: hypothetical protein K7J46_04965 [Bryobacter sp.]|jgi:hypothetical protein|nr:hypothetical protein [Bryobacter sp. CoA8 C33]